MAKRKIEVERFALGKKGLNTIYALSKSGKVYRLKHPVQPKQLPVLKERLRDAQSKNGGKHLITLTEWVKVKEIAA